MHFEHYTTQSQALTVLPMLRTLDEYYPDIENWFLHKVIPGMDSGKNKIIVARDKGIITGFALGKKSEEEHKLRCIRVLPDCQNSGLGIKLIDRMIEAIECKNPHITVSEELLHHYSRIFVTRYGWDLVDVKKGAYRRNKLEYYFNDI